MSKSPTWKLAAETFVLVTATVAARPSIILFGTKSALLIIMRSPYAGYFNQVVVFILK